MKFILITLVSTLFVFTTAISPRYSTLSRQQQPPPNAASPPYNPSGWKPQGERLRLPSQSFFARQETASSPSPTYGPPSPSYGPPTTEIPTTTDVDFTENPQAESFRVSPVRGQKQTAENVERGQYYLLLPNGKLQRVMYVTSADLEKMMYSAKLRYQDVEPITGPIFTTANNQPFIPIFQ